MPFFEGIDNRVFDRVIIYYSNMRVLDWKAYMGMVLLGFVHGLNSYIFVCSNYNMFLKIIISHAFFLAFTFSINNCFDIRSDERQEEKRRKNPLASGHITLKEGLIQSFLLGSIGLGVTFIWFNEESFLIYSFMLFLGLAYSVPPLRFKSVPIIDLISHGLFFGTLLFQYGLLVAGSMVLEFFPISISIFICSIIFELRNQLDDIQADKSSGTRTTACWLGPIKTRELLRRLLILHWFTLLLILWLNDYKIALAASGIILTLSVLLWRDFKRCVKLTDVFTAFVYSYSALMHLIPLLIA